MKNETLLVASLLDSDYEFPVKPRSSRKRNGIKKDAHSKRMVRKAINEGYHEITTFDKATGLYDGRSYRIVTNKNNISVPVPLTHTGVVLRKPSEIGHRNFKAFDKKVINKKRRHDLKNETRKEMQILIDEPDFDEDDDSILEL